MNEGGAHQGQGRGGCEVGEEGAEGAGQGKE